MAYLIVPQEDKFCVFTSGDDGEAVGDPLGSYETSEAASEQIASIEAEANKVADLDDQAPGALSEKNRALIESAIAQSGEAVQVLQDLIAADAPAEERRAATSSLQAIRKLAEDDTSITVGGYGLVWGGRDLYDTYFTKSTDLWLGKFGLSLPIFYDHGFDTAIKKKVQGNLREFKLDDIGLWIAAQLYKHNEYLGAIQALMDKGAIGFSSGSIQHLIEMESDGEIRSWPIVEFSLTTEPAEPRTLGVDELRSIVDAVPALGPMLPEDKRESQTDSDLSASGADSADPIPIDKHTENTRSADMSENENVEDVQAFDYDLLAEKVAARMTPPKEGLGLGPDKEPAQVKSASEFEGVGEFLQAVRRSSGHGSQIDPRLAAIRAAFRATGMSEGVAADGGFLLQPTYANQLLKRVYEVGAITKLTSRLPLGRSSNSTKVPYIDETSRATGSRWGGVQAYWLAEAGTKTSSKPKLGQIELTLKKVIALMYATDELLEDAEMLGAIVNDVFPMELAFMVEDAIINGTGAGTPLGILNATCLVTVPKEVGQAAATLVYENIVKMWARLWARSRPKAVWLINQDVEPQLNAMSLAVGTGGATAYMPAGGLSGQPYSTLMGRPVIPVEYCQTLGTLGDIILADFGEYAMIDKGGIKTDSSIHVNFVYDETAFRWVYRVDGQPKWASALTPKNGTNTLSPFVVLAERA